MIIKREDEEEYVTTKTLEGGPWRGSTPPRYSKITPR
jgi:hypothetical protein